MIRIAHRARLALGTGQYAMVNLPEKVEEIRLVRPTYQQVLRMPIMEYDSGLMLPTELNWTRPIIHRARKYQENIANHPFMYITVRNGPSRHRTVSDWHVDGYSERYTHLPEQNYVWCDNYPTEYAPMAVQFPSDFDPMKHNIHKFLEQHVTDIECIETHTLYCFDPYVLHRRMPSAGHRCFVRITFCPIEIRDANNTFNPQLPKHYEVDGVRDFRDTLISY